MRTERARSPRRRNATLRDVAGRAEVSVATVSRVLAGDYPVADTTRDRVMQAVHELEYSAPPPRSAPRKRARMVAIVAADLTILEETTELLGRLTGGGVTPLFTCPLMKL